MIFNSLLLISVQYHATVWFDEDLIFVLNRDNWNEAMKYVWIGICGLYQTNYDKTMLVIHAEQQTATESTLYGEACEALKGIVKQNKTLLFSCV